MLPSTPADMLPTPMSDLTTKHIIAADLDGKKPKALGEEWQHPNSLLFRICTIKPPHSSIQS
jgi:hypothetical protein